MAKRRNSNDAVMMALPLLLVFFFFFSAAAAALLAAAPAAAAASAAPVARAANAANATLPPALTKSSSSSSPGRPIAGAVLLLGEYDWATSPGSDGLPWSPCADMARVALAEARSSALQFIPTQGFLLGGGGDRINGFCTFISGTQGQASPCDPLTAASASTTARLARFRADMEHCFLASMRAGARTIAIRPHLDSGAGDGAWRNALLLEPSVAYGAGGLSYEDVVLNPIADALAGAQKRWAAEMAEQGLLLQPLPQVDFALQGEMSTTAVRYPTEWRALVEPVRARASAPGCPPVRVGLGLNFNRLDDLSSVSQTHGSSRLSWASWALGLNDLGRAAKDGVPALDGRAVGELLRSVDFVSVSAYAPVSGPGFRPDELGNSAFMLVDQLEAIGVPGARDGLFKPDGPLDLVYGEIGLGGGSSYKGLTRASTAAEVALKPFFGVYGEHDPATDPWALPANAALRREFYAKLAAWLAPGAANKRYDVRCAYLWSKASWDVLGIYDHGYYDGEVARGIRAYNCAAGTGLWDCAEEEEEEEEEEEGVGGGAGGGVDEEDEDGGGGGGAPLAVTVSSASRP